MENIDRVKIERPRTAYKARSDLWRTLFWGCLAMLTVVGVMLGWAIRGNAALQAANHELEGACKATLTADVP